MDKVELIKKCTRGGFKACYYNGAGFGDFKGKIIKIQKTRYLFKRIYIQYMECDGHISVDKEDHVWVLDSAPLKAINAKVGDCVAFSGEVDVYFRKDKSCELGIVAVQEDSAKKISQYELPTNEELLEQNLDYLKCELCLYNSQCDRLFCLKDV